LREERRLKAFENRAMGKIFGPKRDEVKEEWRKLHNEELNDLNCSPHFMQVIKSRQMRWAGNVARMGERGGTYRILVAKPEERNLSELSGNSLDYSRPFTRLVTPTDL
jgi:hypothetical protein